ncbi:MAG TPA: transposase family protein [Acidimicrobiales bacterium]
MCEMLVDLLDVNILGVESRHREFVTVHFECRRVVVGCPECGVLAQVKDRRRIELVDLPMNGRPTRVVWHKRRFFCPDELCPTGHGVKSIPAWAFPACSSPTARVAG